MRLVIHMKKFLVRMLVGLLIFSITSSLSGNALALNNTPTSGEWNVQGNDWSWSFDSNTGELVIRGQGNMTNYDVELPPWLYSPSIASNIKTVILGQGITSIGDSAFSGCYSLESVSIPSSVARIENYAFYGTGLTDVTIPGSVDSIGMYAFADCFQLASVDIENGVEEIEHAVFYRCKELKKINLPDSIHIIREGAFAECASLEEVKIPQGISYLSTDMFSNCSSLKSVEIPSNISNVGIGAFEGCSNLQSAVLAEGVEQINILAFADCSQMKEIYIPASVNFIAGGEYAAFLGCTKLTDIYYSGSKEGWDAIPNSDKLAGLRPEIHYNWSGSSSDAPSTWAVEEIEDARENGLIPEELDEKYQNNITRQEFCQLAVRLIESTIGRNMDDILDYHNVSINELEFSDTNDKNIFAMNALHVVFGVGEGKFEPNRTISREEAATMLTRLAKVLDGKLPNDAILAFNDQTSISDWAYYSVMFVSNMSGKNGSIIMGGTGENRFSPKETYTREQAFLSFDRLYYVIEQCNIAEMHIEQDIDSSAVEITSRYGYLTNRRILGGENWRTLVMSYDVYDNGSYLDEILVSTPERKLQPDEYEVWLKPYENQDIPVEITGLTSTNIAPLKAGVAIATVQSAISGEIWESFYIASADNNSGLLLGTRMPETTIGGLEANFYSAGMYVDNYRVYPVYHTSGDNLNDSSDKLETFIISMDIYNTTGIYGAVDIYDADGNYKSSQRIDKFKILEENLADVLWEACGIIGDIAQNELLTYRQNSYAECTHISVEVPCGGYIVVSNNVTESPGAYMFNFTDFFVEGVSTTVKGVSLANSNVDLDDVSKTFADALLQEMAQKAQSMLADSGMSFVEWINANYNNLSSSEFMNEVVYNGITELEKLNINVIELFMECLSDCAGEQLAGMFEAAFENAAGLAGVSLKVLFFVSDLGNYAVQLNHYNQSSVAKSVNIQYPNCYQQ